MTTRTSVIISASAGPAHFLLVLGTVCSLCWGSAARAQSVPPTPAGDTYVHRAWTSEEGLPQNSVMTMLQTRDGYLWLGTQEGLARFDGVQFTVFDRGNAEGLGHHFVRALHEDRQGRLWIATNGGGLSRRTGNTFTTLTEADGLPSDVVYDVHEDGRGRLWVGTRAGLGATTP